MATTIETHRFNLPWINNLLARLTVDRLGKTIDKLVRHLLPC